MNRAKIFNLIGDITTNTDMLFSKFLESALEDPNAPIVIMINSNGGDTLSGISIFNKLRGIDNTVYTVVTGQCTGIACLILLAPKVANRFCMPYTVVNFNHIKYCAYNDIYNFIISSTLIPYISIQNASQNIYISSKLEEYKISNCIFSFSELAEKF
jgi:hypothetical protein